LPDLSTTVTKLAIN